MAKVYGIAMERTDNTLEDPFITYTNKATAIRVARQLSKSASFDCVKIWVNDADGNGVWSAPIPKWEG